MALTIRFSRYIPVLLVAALLAAVSSGCAASANRLIGMTMTPLPLWHKSADGKRSAGAEEQASAAVVEVNREPQTSPGMAAGGPVGFALPAPVFAGPPAAPPVAPPVVRQVSRSRPTVGEVTSASFQREVLYSDVPVLVDFYADWCGPCKKMAPTLAQMAAETPTVKVVKVNVDENRQLASKYKVRAMPTLMVFKAGQVVQRHQGVADRAKLERMIGGRAAGQYELPLGQR